MKQKEAINLKNHLLEEICDFQGHFKNYFAETNDEDDKAYYLRKIKSHLNKGSSFTAFKRWIIRDNNRLLEELGEYLD